MISKHFLFSFAVATSALGQQPTAEQRLTELERRVVALEKAASTSQRTPAPLERIATEGAPPMQLTSWDYRFDRDERSLGYEITLNLKNVGTKDIKLIDGGIIFKDLLGKTVYTIRLTPDQRVAAGKTLIDKGTYHINQFISEQARMSQMKKEDIQAVLVIRKLVFSDNSIAEYNP